MVVAWRAGEEIVQSSCKHARWYAATQESPVTDGQLILIVDDDAHIRNVVRFALEKAGFVTAEANSGVQALAEIEARKPDLVVLDIMMPEMDGTEVCRRIRARCRMPIIFLSSRDEEIDRIVGLELGGDDYVSKPFSPRELVARVRAVLRRANPLDEQDAANENARAREAKVLGRGPLKLDLDAHKAFWNEHEVVLTVTEFGILRTLLGHPGKVFSRDELMGGAYDEETVVSDRTIDSHVRRVRQKFEKVGGDPIRTVFGVGYQLGIE
jgi:two-component system OmpR family response regulator